MIVRQTVERSLSEKIAQLGSEEGGERKGGRKQGFAREGSGETRWKTRKRRMGVEKEE